MATVSAVEDLFIPWTWGVLRVSLHVIGSAAYIQQENKIGRYETNFAGASEEAEQVHY